MQLLNLQGNPNQVADPAGKQKEENAKPDACVDNFFGRFHSRVSRNNTIVPFNLSRWNHYPGDKTNCRPLSRC